MHLSNWEFLILFLGMMVVTYFPRLLPVTILSKFNLPPFILECLEYLPVAILGALLFPTLFLIHGEIEVSLNNTYLIAGVFTTVVAILTKKLHWSVLTGIFVMFLLTNYV